MNRGSLLRGRGRLIRDLLVTIKVGAVVYILKVLVLLRFNDPVNNIQSCREGDTASWVLPVLFEE